MLHKEIDQDLTGPVERTTGATVTRYEDDAIYRKSAKETLTEHFHTDSLRGFGAEELTAGLEAAAMLLDYLNRTNKGALQSISSLATYSTSGFMVLDAAARRNLELTHSMSAETRGASLLSIVDKTRTAMGGRMIRKWLDQPLLEVKRINRRLEAYEEILNREAKITERLAVLNKDVLEEGEGSVMNADSLRAFCGFRQLLKDSRTAISLTPDYTIYVSCRELGLSAHFLATGDIRLVKYKPWGKEKP